MQCLNINITIETMNEKFCVRNNATPKTIYYVPNFISSDEEMMLLSSVNNAPKPKWKTLSNRRLQNWGGLPHPKGMIVEDIPQWLELNAINKVSQLNLFGANKPNHVLINEYLSGQGIMPHSDGPLYYPTVTTITLGSHTLLEFYQKRDNDSEQQNTTAISPQFSLLLERRSLLVLSDDAYNSYLHGISERSEDVITHSVSNLSLCDGISVGNQLSRETRVSLTIRFVPKVIKNIIFLSKRV